MKSKDAVKAIMMEEKGKKASCYDLNTEVKRPMVTKRKRPCTELSMGGCHSKHVAFWAKRSKIQLAQASLKCQSCLNPTYRNGPHQLCCIPCGHLYGYDCIKKWLIKHPMCPDCKQICYIPQIRLLCGDQIPNCPEVASGAAGAGGGCRKCFPRGLM